MLQKCSLQQKIASACSTCLVTGDPVTGDLVPRGTLFLGRKQTLNSGNVPKIRASPENKEAWFRPELSVFDFSGPEF